MHTTASLSELKLNSNSNSIPKGLVHISPNNVYIDALLGKMGKYIEEDFYVNSAQETGEKVSILHYDGENYTLDYSAFAYPHFGVVQPIKRLLKPRYSFFLYKPLLEQEVFALLIVSNTVLESFLLSDGYWFDINFMPLEDGYDGFSSLNKTTPLPTSEEEARKLAEERLRGQQNNNKGSIRKKKKSKYPFWSALGFADPIPAGENDDPAYDYARREYNKKYTHNGFPPVLLLAICLFVVSIIGFMYYNTGKANGDWVLKARKWEKWKMEHLSFVNMAPEKVDNATLESYVGKILPVKAGSFKMGMVDPKNKQAAPVHTVRVTKFKMMETEVTFEQWDRCVEAGACTNSPSDEGWGRNQNPVVNVSYNDIVDEFIPWLYQETGYHFDLPSEAEWEYAARAGTTTAFVFEGDLTCEKANWGHYNNHRSYSGPYCGHKDENKKTQAVKSYAPNDWGFYDMYGNVSEIVNDIYHDNYEGAPTDGSPWGTPRYGEEGNGYYNGLLLSLRGGNYSSGYHSMKSGSRTFAKVNNRKKTNGFRLVLRD